MAKVQVKTKGFTDFGALEPGEYFFFRNDLYLKVDGDTAYCFVVGEFINFYCNTTVKWVDDDKITITIEDN